MCGICGYIGPTVDKSHLDSMLDVLVPRGPDEEGRYDDQTAALGIRRLAVIDMAGGRQPMTDLETGTVIVYNGELYNHDALRSKLQGFGHSFSSRSDTEVVLRAFLEFGEEFVNHLSGMFAIAVWEPKSRRLLLARDPLGQKPLYFWQQGSRLVFASDLRSVTRHPWVTTNIDPLAVTAYLQFRHVPGPGTIFKDVQHLAPGFVLILKDGKADSHRYWEPRFVPDESMNLRSAVEQFDALWPAVVRRHMSSDVPIGAFLSGGIDSSLVVSEAAKINPELSTYSIGFSDRWFDETPYAIKAAELFGTQHQVISFQSGLESLLEDWKKAYDQPFSDPALFPTLILAKETSKTSTVVLTGDGGDELFAGYQRYRTTLIARYISSLPRSLRHAGTIGLETIARLTPLGHPLRRWLNSFARRLVLIEPDVEREYIRQFFTFDDASAAELTGFSLPHSHIQGFDHAPNLLTRMLRRDLENWLPDQMLVKVDRATMVHSLEARLPLLDSELVDFALTIPPRLHIKGGILKRVLREAARNRLPRNLVERPKHGFQVPVDDWLRQEIDFVNDVFVDGLSRSKGFIRSEPVWSLWKEHQQRKANHGERLLTLLIFFIWECA